MFIFLKIGLLRKFIGYGFPSFNRGLHGKEDDGEGMRYGKSRKHVLSDGIGMDYFLKMGFALD